MYVPVRPMQVPVRYPEGNPKLDPGEKTVFV
jgi:hypothetical protein